jgi:hypothetical protein
MAHQPFESWIISKEPLLPYQQQALQEHMQSCAYCLGLSTAWNEVEELLRESPFEAPVPGFTIRWKEKLENMLLQQYQRHERRLSWSFIGLAAAGSLLVLAILAYQFLAANGSATQVLVESITFFASMATLASVLQELVTTFVGVALIVIPPVWWIVVAAVLSLLSLAWVFSLQRIMFSRRIVQ